MTKYLYVAPFLLMCSCTITTINISQKTALENQLLGEMAPLSDEELLIASVRNNTTEQNVPSMAPAVAARRRQLFNRDDTDEYKAAGCVGEALNTLLVSRPCPLRSDSALETRLQKLLKEENQDRKILVDWMISNDPTLTPADRPQVQTIYHDLLLRSSPEGTLQETGAGTWIPKTAKPQTEIK